MGIGSWWRKLWAREDEFEIRKATEEQNETPAERRYTHGADWEALGADTAASAGLHGAEPNIDSADRLSED
jgi:hypothetical protein